MTKKKFQGAIHDWYITIMIDEDGNSTQHISGLTSGGKFIRTSIVEDIRVEIFGGLIKMVAETMNSLYLLDNFKHP